MAGREGRALRFAVCTNGVSSSGSEEKQGTRSPVCGGGRGCSRMASWEIAVSPKTSKSGLKRYGGYGSYGKILRLRTKSDRGGFEILTTFQSKAVVSGGGPPDPAWPKYESMLRLR